MTEITLEEKAIIIMARQAVEIALHNCSFRWLLCHDCQDHQPDDCGCVITWKDENLPIGCGCKCHERIRELDRLISTYYQSIREHQTSWFKDRDITGQKFGKIDS